MDSSFKTSLSVIVPVYNEEHLVEESLKRLRVLQNGTHLERIQVVVVDDCSRDGTRDILERLSAELPSNTEHIEWLFLRHETNRGKGGAIQTALNHVNGDITIIHDSDLEYHPQDILRMIPLFLEEDADAVYGSRFAVHEYRRVLLFRHELGNRFLTFFSNLVSNLNLTDMETCYKAVRTTLLKSIPLKSNDFRIEPELTIKLAKRKAKIFEVPINYTGRTYQEGKKINWKDGFKAALAIAKFGISDDIFTEDEFGSKILARLRRANRFNAWMADMIRPYIGQNVLEIGSGVGNLTDKLIPRKTYYATDINPLYLHTINNLKEDKPYLSAAYLDLNDIADFRDQNKYFDTVICLNVIEHLDDDFQAMKNISGLIEKDGKAIVLVPRGQWLYGTLDEVLGHKRRYSVDVLKKLADEADLRVHKIVSFNRISSIPWFVNGKILKRRAFGYFQILVLNLLTPIFKRIDKYLPVPSMSFIAILEK